MRLAHTTLAALFILPLWTTSVEAAVCYSGQVCLCTTSECSSLAWNSRLSCCGDSCGGPISNNLGFACTDCSAVEHAVSCDGGRVTECEPGYTPFENTCQSIIPSSCNALTFSSAGEPTCWRLFGRMIWDAAKTTCESEGGHLPTTSTQEEYDELTAAATQLELERIHLGYRDQPGGGYNFQWVDGSPPGFENWAVGQPNEDIGTCSAADFPPLRSLSWFDYRCEWLNEVTLCEIKLSCDEADNCGLCANHYLDGGTCRACSVCDPTTQVQTTECGSSSDTVCECVAANFYDNNGVCTACTVCDATSEIQTAACGSSSDAVCECAANFYDNNGVCTACTVCDATSEIQTAACGSSSDAVCECAANFYDNNGVCTACTVCDATSEIQTAACGSSSDAVCECAAGYWDNAGTCEEVDACAVDGCGAAASCEDLPPPAEGGKDGRACTCNAGYGNHDDSAPEGTPAAGCTEIDACVNFPCGADATCVDLAAPALDDAEGRSCACNAGFFGDGESCAPVGATSESYSVAVESQFGDCPEEIGGSAKCWHIAMSLAGSIPQRSEHALYLYGAAGVDPIRFPCSLADTKCTCLDSMIADYVATTLEATACSGGSYNAAAYPTALTSMYNAAGVEYNDIHVSVSPDNTTYTLVVAATAMERIPQAVTEIDGGFRWELHVGFAELLPVGDLDHFDVVPHETTVMLEQTFFASYSSVSAQKTTSLQFANARVHKVHNTTADQYYVAVSFVVDGGNVTDVNIPTSSIVVEAGGNAIDVACTPGGAFSGQAAAFSRSCGPFPGDDTPPFCAGTLHVSGSSGLASVFVPLNEMPSEDSLRMEFVISTRGVDAPTLETVAVTVNNLGASGGFVEWCEDAVSDLIDFVADSALEVDMYAGVVLPEDAGLMSLASLGSMADDTQVPAPRATIMDGVISVAVNYSSGFDAEVVKLAAVYVEEADPGESVISNYLTRIPVAEYDPATGVVSMNTDNLCVDDAGACEVKVLDVGGGSTPECLALKSESVNDEDAGNWLRDVAGTSNPFIAEVGQHFYEQFADFKEAYWINPRKDTTATAVSVGSTIPATTVAVFALVRVSARAAERRSSRYLLQTVGGGSDSLSSGVVRLEVSAASLAASVLGVSPEVVTTWSVQMSISAAEECLPDQELIKLARARLLAALADAASELVDVQVTSVKLDAAEVNCPPQGRRLLADNTPTMEVEALIIFADDGSKPFIDVAKLEAAPGIKSVTQSDTSSIVTVVESSPAYAEEQHTDPEPLKTQIASNSLMVIVASAAGVVAVVAVGVALLVWRRTATRRCEDAVLLSAAAVHGSFSKGAKMEQVLGDVTCMLEVDTHSDSATRCSSVRMVESRA